MQRREQKQVVKQLNTLRISQDLNKSLRSPAHGQFRRIKYRWKSFDKQNNSSMAYDNRRRHPLLKLSQQQIEQMNEELIRVWDNESIPQIHREIFLKKISQQETMKKAKHIAREIHNIENKESDISLLVKAIQDREYHKKCLKQLSNQIKQLEKKTGIKVFIRLGSQHIANYRQATISFFSKLKQWCRQFQCKEDQLIWEGKCYLQKVGSDMRFLFTSKINDTLKASWPDPFLKHFVQQMQKYAKKMKIETIRQLEVPFSIIHLLIKYTNILKPYIKKLQKQESSNEKETEICYTTQTEEPQPIKVTKTPYYKQILQEIMQSYVFECVDEIVNTVSPQCVNKLINASLYIYSSQLQDNIVTEVLGFMVPEAAHEAWEEITDFEYMGIRDWVIINAVELESFDIVSNIFNKKLSRQIFLSQIDSMREEVLEIMIQECFDEEHILNTQVSLLIREELIQEFLDQEWLEVFVENQYSEDQLDKIRDQLPGYIQAAFFEINPNYGTERMSDLIYFGILNKFVAGFWLEGLVNSWVSVLQGGEKIWSDEIFVLSDPDIPPEPPKRNFLRRRINI